MKARHYKNRERWRGSTVTELVVAATILATLMGILAPLTVRTGWVWRDSRHHQLALDELSNHLDRLLALSPEKRESELSSLEVSDAVRWALPDAKLSAKEVSDRDGQRLELSIDWRRKGPALPLTLIGWIDASQRSLDDEESANE